MQVQKSTEQTGHTSQWIGWPESVRRNYGLKKFLTTYLNLTQTNYVPQPRSARGIHRVRSIRGMACSLYLAQQGALGYLKF